MRRHPEEALRGLRGDGDAEAAGRRRPEGSGGIRPIFALDHDGVVPVKVVTDPADLAPSLSEVDVERVRAAVTLALDAALPAMIDKITEQVLSRWVINGSRRAVL